MNIEIEKSTNSYIIYINDMYFQTDDISTTIEDCIMNLKQEFNDSIHELMSQRNQCPECLQQCGYNQYAYNEDFYCPFCEKWIPKNKGK